MNFLRKAIGSLVEMEAASEAASKPGSAGAASMSDADIDALLASAGAATGPAAAPVAPSPAAPARTPLDWTLVEVFRAGGIQEGRNSADTVLKLFEGLKALPPDQRLIAIRAMDAADDGWDEATVLADAERRLQILAHFGGHIDRDVASRVAAVKQEFQTRRTANDAEIARIDEQIARLQAQRDQIVKATAEAQGHADEQERAIHERGRQVQAGTTAAAEKYKTLVTVFRPLTSTPGA